MSLFSYYAESVRELQRRLTLKALANSSPGFAMKPWEHRHAKIEDATLKGLRRYGGNHTRRNSFRVTTEQLSLLFPRVTKAPPWVGIGERLQRYIRTAFRERFQLFKGCL